MKLYKLLLIAACVVMAAAFRGDDKKNKAGKADILAANLDTTVNPADDFFEYANGGWIKAHPIPGDQSNWGIGNLVVEENNNRLREIAEKAARSKTAPGTAAQKIGDFWAVAMDSNKIEHDGIKPLKPYLDKIDAVNDSKQLQAVFAEFSGIGVRGPIAMSVGQDDKNSSQYALQMRQTGIGLPEREYYFKSDAATVEIRAAYVKYMAHLLAMIGEDTA